MHTFFKVVKSWLYYSPQTSEDNIGNLNFISEHCKYSQVEYHRPLILALSRQRQVDLCEIEASLVYGVNCKAVIRTRVQFAASILQANIFHTPLLTIASKWAIFCVLLGFLFCVFVLIHVFVSITNTEEPAVWQTLTLAIKVECKNNR